jgi:hypothetical protein
VDNESAPPLEQSGNRRARAAEWGSVVAIAISALALAIGAYQTRLMQAQARASVWPYVKIGFGYAESGESAGFNIHIQNNGVGPAIVKSVRVFLDDKPLHGWLDAYPILLGHGEGHPKLEGLSGVVIPPSTNRETDVHAIRIGEPDQAAKFFDAVDRFKIDICYCSVYDECWTAHWLVSKVDVTAVCQESKDEFDY